MDPITFILNGKQISVNAQPNMMLVDLLRDILKIKSVKVGCSEGECGACTVLLDGNPVASCILPAYKVQDREIVTLEGLSGANGDLHPLQQAFLAEGAVQCGFCTPGMILASKALLDKKPDPTEAEIRKALTGHLCRCTGYNSIIKAIKNTVKTRNNLGTIPIPDERLSAVVGMSMARKDGPSKVTGVFQYGADLERDNLLHGALLFSQHPYALVKKLDISKAKKASGVIIVLTAEDVPGKNTQGIIIQDQPVFVPVGSKVLSIADVLACVVAVSAEAARDAVELIAVEYELLQGVFTPEEALAEDAPILHPRPDQETPSNIMYRTHIEKGDIERALAEAVVKLEETFYTPFQEHAYLEPEAGLAEVDQSGVVCIWMASQAITIHRFMVARVLGLPPDKLRLIHISPGGAFGARNDISLHAYLGLGAISTGRPVQIVLTRKESLRFHVKRHAMQHRLRLGATHEGDITALDVDILADTGAYASVGIPVLDQATLFATGPYEIPSVRIKGTSVYTNNIACGAFRGFGIPQSAFAVESLIDELAEVIGVDPFTIRRRNGLRPGSSTATGQVIEASLPYIETLSEVESALKRSLGELELPQFGHKRGIGIASCFKNVGLGLGMPESTGAGIDLQENGRILVRVGGAELGQGSRTVLSQIAAEAIGVPYGWIDIIDCDTGLTPDGGITSASRTTFMSGHAVLLAGKKFTDTLKSKFDFGLPYSMDKLKDLARKLATENNRLSVEAVYHPPPTHSLENLGDDERTKFISFSFATQAAIVDINPKTCEVYVRKMIAAHDIGRAINPNAAIGQIEGSCIIGMGYAISEEFILDKGYLATDTLAKVGIPTINHSPILEVILIEDPDPNGPLGAKGIAEAATIPSAPAITNAIHDAIKVRVRRLPATPDRIVVDRNAGH